MADSGRGDHIGGKYREEEEHGCEGGHPAGARHDECDGQHKFCHSRQGNRQGRLRNKVGNDCFEPGALRFNKVRDSGAHKDRCHAGSGS